MVLRRVAKFMFVVFGVRREIDYVLRPLLMLILIGALDTALRTLVLDQSFLTSLRECWITMVVASPFVALSYVLIIYQGLRQKDLANTASTDELTQLPNRRAFFERAGVALKSGMDGFFLIIDADHFKRVNDTLGHQSGDVCLQAVADRIKSLSREGDIIGRIGGEEFGMILLHRSMEDLQRLAGRLCFPINVSIHGHSEPLRLTVSAGATEIWPEDMIADLTTRADEALIAAKNNGRERMVLWRPAARAA